jgi:hypothetical protein
MDSIVVASVATEGTIRYTIVANAFSYGLLDSVIGGNEPFSVIIYDNSLCSNIYRGLCLSKVRKGKSSLDLTETIFMEVLHLTVQLPGLWAP